ncbi:hypothetical protein ASD8599_01212 [Ascidiaceihabitans donghaensis]|uniref:Uncharacterized protein n=1 Tax=Ascidiaceihabitans donghaensis TaxID=1510460 RepID=A0A2R8BBM9_9RHOB|nr:hypothetical protein [Ascidiaceihabitans donghaensis]SPH20476.1 hypothetical protein ASD8599_01212 [Ascidiaceihabitans donghaensis]
MFGSDDYKNKVLARRAARARRSRWLSKVTLFALGLGAAFFIRTQPEATAEIMAWVQQSSTQYTRHADLTVPKVRAMPLDKVTVNRGGALNPQTSSQGETAQGQADALGRALKQMKVGG